MENLTSEEFIKNALESYLPLIKSNNLYEIGCYKVEKPWRA